MMHVIFAEGLEDAEFLATRTDGADDSGPGPRNGRSSAPLGRPASTLSRSPTVARLGPPRARIREARAGREPPAARGPGVPCRALAAGGHGPVEVPGRWRPRAQRRRLPDAGRRHDPPDLRVAPAARKVAMTGLGDALRGARNGDGINALVVYNCNPAVVCPDTNAVTRGLAREDLFTVVLELMPTDTMRYADVVLPATTQLEHLDVLWSWGHYYLSLNRPAIPPRGQTLPNTEIFRRLASEMGFDEPELHEDDEALVETYLADCTDEQRAALDAQGYVKMPVVTAPDARVQLRSDMLAEIAGIDPLPQGEDPHGGRRAHPDHAEVAPLPQLPAGQPRTAPQSRRPCPRARRTRGRQAAGIVDGAPVVLTNEHGTLELDASVSENVLAGTVVVLDNWWHGDVRRGPGVNALTGQAEADLGAAPVFTARVQISPVPA